MAATSKMWGIWKKINQFGPGEVPEGLWQEYLDTATTFEDYAAGCQLDRQRKALDWRRKFVEKMAVIAKLTESDAGRKRRWRRVSKDAEPDQPEFEKAVTFLWGITEGTPILYRWRKLEEVLPESHPLYEKVKKQGKLLRAKGIKKKKKAKAA